jgi:hypothetical protein
MLGLLGLTALGACSRTAYSELAVCDLSRFDIVKGSAVVAPDASMIAFKTRSKTGLAYVIQGQKQREFKTLGDLHFSREGSFVYAGVDKTGAYMIHEGDALGPYPRVLHGSPFFNEQGKWVAITESKGRQTLWIEGKPRPLPHPASSLPVFSESGKHFALLLSNNKGQIWVHSDRGSYGPYALLRGDLRFIGESCAYVAEARGQGGGLFIEGKELARSKVISGLCDVGGQPLFLEKRGAGWTVRWGAKSFSGHQNIFPVADAKDYFVAEKGGEAFYYVAKDGLGSSLYRLGRAVTSAEEIRLLKGLPQARPDAPGPAWMVKRQSRWFMEGFEKALGPFENMTVFRSGQCKQGPFMAYALENSNCCVWVNGKTTGPYKSFGRIELMGDDLITVAHTPNQRAVLLKNGVQVLEADEICDVLDWEQGLAVMKKDSRRSIPYQVKMGRQERHYPLVYYPKGHGLGRLGKSLVYYALRGRTLIRCQWGVR